MRQSLFLPIQILLFLKMLINGDILIKKNSPGIPIACKLIDGNIGEFKNKILSIPLYMAMFL